MLSNQGSCLDSNRGMHALGNYTASMHVIVMVEYFDILDTLVVSSVAGGGFDGFLVDFEGDRAKEGSCSVVADGRGALITGAT